MLVLDNGDKIQGDASTAAEVDYTIHGMTGTTLSQLADGQLADSKTDMYTAAAIVVVKAITFVNTGAAARTVNLYLLPSGGTARRILAKDCILSAGHSLHYDGVKITVLSSTGSIVYSYAAHATSHTDGSDDIQNAEAGQKGLATAAQITKLNAIEALADVTDATNVAAATALMKAIAGEFTKTLNFNETELTDGATIAWDLESNQICFVTITANRTMGAPTNHVQGATYILVVIQDGGGGNTLSWHADYKWEGDVAPTIASGADERTIIMFKDDGTYLYGTIFWVEN
jgi:hypothetical protein